MGKGEGGEEDCLSAPKLATRTAITTVSTRTQVTCPLGVALIKGELLGKFCPLIGSKRNTSAGQRDHSPLRTAQVAVDRIGVVGRSLPSWRRPRLRSKTSRSRHPRRSHIGTSSSERLEGPWIQVPGPSFSLLCEFAVKQCNQSLTISRWLDIGPEYDISRS